MKAPSHAAALAAGLALAAPASPARAAPIDIVPGTQAPACPDQVDVHAALSAQAGDAAPAPGWRLSYRSEGRGGVSLELADDRGLSRLRRRLRVDSSDCRARAEAIALIVYRFFGQLADAQPEGVGSDPQPQPPPVQTAVSIAPASVPAAGRPAARLRLLLEAGAGLWTRRPGTGTGVFGLRGARGNVEAAFNLLAPGAPVVERPAGGGEVEVSALGLASSLGLVSDRGRLRVHGGPLAIACRESARSRGIATPAANTGTTVALGLAAGGSWGIGAGFRLGFEAGLAHAAFGHRFVVGGWGRVVPPPAWQGMALAHLGYAISP